MASSLPSFAASIEGAGLQPHPVDGIVNCAAYANGCRVANIKIDEIGRTLEERPDCFVWVGLHEPDNDVLRKIQQAFHLHDLAIEDALHSHQRPKIERYGDSLFVVLRTGQIGQEGCHIDFGETHVFVGHRFLVSVRHGASLPYTEVRSRCEAAPRLLLKGPGFVLYALMDFIVDQYFPVLDTFEDEVETIERNIFAGSASRETTARIYTVKRDLLAVKRAVSPLIDICNRLVRFDFDQISEDTRPYFRDVYDHVVRINEVMDGLRELLATALEANLSLMSVSQNEDMKRLAGWAAIIAVPTMIAGIYGMNFSFMPELQWRYGYFTIMTLMIGLCVGLYVFLKRSGWL